MQAAPDDFPKGFYPGFDVWVHLLHEECPKAPLPPLQPGVVLIKDGPFDYTKADIEACLANALLNIWHAAKKFAESPEHTERGKRFVAVIEERMRRSKVSSGPLNIAADNMLAQVAATGRDFAQRGFSVVFHLKELSLFIVPEHLQIK